MIQTDPVHTLASLPATDLNFTSWVIGTILEKIFQKFSRVGRSWREKSVIQSLRMETGIRFIWMSWNRAEGI